MKNKAKELLRKFNDLISEKTRIIKKLDFLASELNLIVKTTMFLTSFSEYCRDKIKNKLEKLANSALNAIFQDKDMEFKIISNKTMRGLNYDLYIFTNGEITPLIDCKGGGVLDVISLSLKISFLKMFSDLRQVMILDEPFKNLDAERINLAVEWLKEISTKLSIQFLIVTHEEEIMDIADKKFIFKLENGVTKIVT